MNLSKFNKSVTLNQTLSKHNWFNVGGNAEILFVPEDIKDLIGLLKSKPKKYEIYPIGAGSNILVSDKGIKGITLITKKLNQISIDNFGVITAQAGAVDADVARFARDQERTGLEFLVGIPGTIGGGIKMNSGAFGAEFKDILIDVKAINNLGEIKTFSNKELQMGYRKIGLSKEWIFYEARFKSSKDSKDKITTKMNLGEIKTFSNKELQMGYRKIGLSKEWIFYEARFKSSKDSKDKITTKMRRIIHLRKEAQPTAVKTGGSTFKNPINKKAWKLIDEAGCRGLQNGDAMISEKHCNFIINLKKSTSQEIEELAQMVQDKVFEKSGIRLDWEIQRVGIK